METVKEIVVLLGGFTVLVGVLGWLAREIIKLWMTKSVETHKDALKAVSDIEIEKFKDELKRAAFIRETQFSTVHAQVVTAIREVSVPLKKVYDVAMEYLSPAEYVPKNEVAGKIGPAFNDFKEAYDRNRIMLPKDVTKSLDDFVLETTLSLNRFRSTKRTNEQLNRITDPEGKDHWTIGMDAMEKQVKPAHAALEARMQEILGFEVYAKKCQKTET